jgi:hypothetical protein
VRPVRPAQGRPHLPAQPPLHRSGPTTAASGPHRAQSYVARGRDG